MTDHRDAFSIVMREDAAGFGLCAQEFEEAGFGHDGGESLEFPGVVKVRSKERKDAVFSKTLWAA